MARYRYTFISHAHADNDICDAFAIGLTQWGIPHYYDRENPQIGHAIDDALKRQLKRARALVVLASPEAIDSNWVNGEIAYFLDLMDREKRTKRQPEPERILIPVMIKPCDLPINIQRFWRVDGIGRPEINVVEELAHSLEDDTPDSYTCVVDCRDGMGDYNTITDAITNARPGERILVRKGIYNAGLIIDKQLEIVGDGQPGDVEVRASGTSVILFRASGGRVANLTLRQTGEHWRCVDIATGQLELASCDISSQGNACVAIHHAADPRIHKCKIHHGKQSGIFVYDRGLGLIEECDITANTFAGIEIKTGSSPTIRSCHIQDGKAAGIIVHDQGQGVIEDCDINANEFVGIEIKSGATPTVRKCRINQNKSEAIYVHQGGRGVFEENDLTNNDGGPWDIASDSGEVTRRGNNE